MKNSIRKIIQVAAVFVLSMALFSGCSLFRRDLGRADNYEVVVINSVDDMEDLTYYVKKDENAYHRLYVGNNTFGSRTTSSAAPSRIAWFGKDFDKIPTMYRGEMLVFHAEGTFQEGVNIERFKDTGYTIGIGNLKQTETGRYSFSTSPERLNIDINSSAGQVYELGDRTAVLDSIGQAKLREGNVSESGTVIGLSEGKTYSTYVYIGTNAHHYNMVADVRALVSTEVTRLWDFEYTRDRTIEFAFPPSFNSGYYLVGNYGIVRYVNSDQPWDETMDMNIPNEYRTAEGETGYDETDRIDNEVVGEQALESQDVETLQYNSTEEGTYRITINYEVVDKMPAPTAKVVGPQGAETLELKEEGRLQGQYNLATETYEIQIVGSNGRNYTYKIEDAEAAKERDAEEPETTEASATETPAEEDPQDTNN